MISEHTTLISLFEEEQIGDLGVVVCKYFASIDRALANKFSISGKH